MDFITGLPKAKGKDTVLVVVDRLQSMLTSSPFNTLLQPRKWLNTLLTLDSIVKLHGFPTAIIFNRD